MQEFGQRWWRVGVIALGLLLTGLGIWQAVQQSRGHEVELVEQTTADTQEGGKIEAAVVVVDVGGEVLKPGLYRFDTGIRVGEVLAAAGGLTEAADQDWVGRSMNQAEMIKDGQKIYIPSISETDDENLKSQNSNVKTNGVAGAATININTATAAQLDSLWGIGEARAKQIIENRPYTKVEELMTKAGIPKNVFETNEGQWSVY